MEERPISATEVQILEAGVWVVMHSRALKFPGVVKDYALGTFVRAD